MKRKQITTRTRFEIFKRDSFTCQYCGQKPPLAILHVDHIVPVSAGGSYENENLLTSCSTCNLGKSDVSLDRITSPIAATIAEERERVNQVKLYNKHLRAINKARSLDFKEVSDCLISAQGKNPNEFVISGKVASSVRTFLKILPKEEILESVQISDERIGFEANSYKAFKYFCGVCWNKVKTLEGVVK